MNVKLDYESKTITCGEIALEGSVYQECVLSEIDVNGWAFENKDNHWYRMFYGDSNFTHRQNLEHKLKELQDRYSKNRPYARKNKHSELYSIRMNKEIQILKYQLKNYNKLFPEELI